MSSPDDFANSLHALPSVSSTVRSPALPWEVIERVIDLCSGDKNTLRTFALTCSQLHPRSLFILFTNVELRCATQLKGFYDSVQAQSHLQPVVQSLSFPWNACSPFSLLSILPSLRHVTFDTIPGFNGLWPPPALPNYLYHRPFVTGIRSLTIRRTWFRAGNAFLHFLSAFPNVESLTCEDSSLTTSETTPMVQDHLSPQLQLRTLNILRGVCQHVTELLFQTARLAITSPLVIGEQSVPPPQSGEGHQTSLTWWMKARIEDFHQAIRVLSNSKETAISDVTLVLWDESIGSLYNNCCQPASLELCEKLEKVLLRYPLHRVLLTVPGGPVLNARKTISWSDEIRRCFRPLSEKWALTEDVRYSGKPGHDSSVTAFGVSSDGRWVATASLDTTIILWDARDGCISQEWISHNGEVLDLAFAPDGRHLASAGADGEVAIWDISGGSSYKVATLEGHTASMSPGCAWSSSGARIASRDPDGTVLLWDGRTFQPLPLDLDRHGDIPTTQNKPLFSPDGHWLLYIDAEGCHLCQNDVLSGAYLTLPFQRDREHEYPLSAVFSASSTHVAVVFQTGRIRVWDIVTQQEYPLCEAHGGWLNTVVFSPDGRLLLSASRVTVQIWDARAGAMDQSFDGHETLVHQACFSPCGRFIASASSDRTVRVWRTSDGSCLATLSDHGGQVKYVAFTPDGEMLWSAADNGTVLAHRLQDIIPEELKLWTKLCSIPMIPTFGFASHTSTSERT